MSGAPASLEARHRLGRKRDVMRAFPLEIAAGAGDFALAVGHRLTAISLFTGTRNSAAAFSIAVASSGAYTAPTGPQRS